MKTLFCLAGGLMFVGVAFAQAYVPIQQEPKHHLRFQNDYVRVFDVVVPPGQSTLYHRHGEDYVYVFFGDAALKAQALGQQEQDLNVQDGEVKFAVGPLIHRVRNIGSRPFHNLTVELLHAPGVSAAASSDRLGAHQTVVLDNHRIRILRTILKPGEATGVYALSHRSITVAVRAGIGQFSGPGKISQQHRFTPGDFDWNDAPLTRDLENVGRTSIELLDIEVK